LSLQQVAEVLQRLVRENVPLRPLPLILESMARWGQTTRNPQYLTERVRKDLAPTIAARFSSSPGRVTFLAVDPDLEDLVEASVEDLPEGQVVGMSDEDRARVIAACEAAAAKSPASVLVVEHAPVRRPLRSIIERQLPHVAVMSYDELPREVAVKNAGTVSLTERP
jgi:type III secretory pathway component EscV